MNSSEESMGHGKLFVLSAPSGAGKSTIIARIRPIFPDMLYSISCTTRTPRGGETDGVDYYFVTRQQFERMVEHGEFLEWKVVHGNLYGTPAGPVTEALSQGQHMILDIDVQGAQEVFVRIPGAVGVFINAPSLDVLERRLRARGTDSEGSIRTRLRNAVKEIEMARAFKYHIVNDELEKAVSSMAEIIRDESQFASE
jgi:guanylate kinase